MTDSSRMGRPDISELGRPRASDGLHLNSWLARRRRDDRGATLVEAAFVTPVFILMLFGIFEFTGNIMVRNGSDAAIKGGARMAVVAGNDAMADRAILNRMATEGAGIQQDRIEQIVIWHASSPDEDVPSDCTAATGYRVVDSTNRCNVYNDPQNPTHGAFTKARLPLSKNLDTSSTLELGIGTADYWFGCTSADPDNKLDCGWEPQDRRIRMPAPGYTCTPSPADDPKCQPTDLLGIYIRVRHDNYTGFFGDSITVTKQTIATIEPQEYDK